MTIKERKRAERKKREAEEKKIAESLARKEHRRKAWRDYPKSFKDLITEPIITVHKEA